MSGNAKTIYRVHVNGLSPTERTVFGGVIHLAEHRGTFFEIQTGIDSSDVYVLDGGDPPSLELGCSDAYMAERTIWIDPPANQHTVRQVKRPVRWALLLEMMEQIVGTSQMAPTAAPLVPASRLALDQLCSISQQTLREHIGIAAEFVVEDVRAEVLAATDSQGETSRTVFLEILRKQLPANVDAAKILDDISNALARDERG